MLGNCLLEIIYPLQGFMKNSPVIYLEILVDLIAEIWQVLKLDFHLQALRVKGHCWVQDENSLSLPQVFCHLALVTSQSQVSITPHSISRKLYTQQCYFQETDSLVFVTVLNKGSYYSVGSFLESFENASGKYLVMSYCFPM